MFQALYPFYTLGGNFCFALKLPFSPCLFQYKKIFPLLVSNIDKYSKINESLQFTFITASTMQIMQICLSFKYVFTKRNAF